MADSKSIISGVISESDIIDSLKNIEKAVEKSTTVIADKFDSMINKLEGNFSKLASTASDGFGAATKGAGEGAEKLKQGLSAVLSEMEKVKSNFKNSAEYVDDYSTKMAELTNQLKTYLYQANLTNTKIKSVPSISLDQQKDIEQKQQVVNLEKLRIPQLQQVLTITNNIISAGQINLQEEQKLLNLATRTNAILKERLKPTESHTIKSADILPENTINDIAKKKQVLSSIVGNLVDEKDIEKVNKDIQRLANELKRLNTIGTEVNVKPITLQDILKIDESTLGGAMNKLSKLKEYQLGLKINSQEFEDAKKLIDQLTKDVEDAKKKAPITINDVISIDDSTLNGITTKIKALKELVSITKINAVDQNGVSLLEQYKQQLTELESKAKSIQQLPPKKLVEIDAMAEDSVDNINKKLKELKSYQKDTKVNLQDPDSKKANEDLLNKIEELKRKLKEINTIPVSQKSLTQIMGMSASSVNERIAKIKELEKVQRSLSTTDADYASKIAQVNTELRNLRAANNEVLNSSKELANNNNKLIETFNTLLRRVAVYATFSYVKTLTRDIAQIRGQYEVIERSLGAIIKDYDKARQLFNQQQAAALKSPFTVVDLTTATKQLSAYGIEVDKLASSTKMLADVSAGVGVELERLTYNFGQIKAKGFLDARDARDFGNAGINVTGALADMYSKLEKRMVSVGEVYDRMSNKMVSFGDVEKVLQRMTEEGGTFFDMQATQAETLKGQLSNLEDAYGNMMNEIGKANQGAMIDGIKLVKLLYQNWEEVVRVIQQLIVIMGTYKAITLVNTLAATKYGKSILWCNSALQSKVGSELKDIAAMTRKEAALMGVTTGQYAMGKATMFAQTALLGLKSLFLTALPFALISGLIALYNAMTKASREAAKLNTELNKIANQGAETFDKSVKTLKQLAGELSKVNIGSKNHLELIDKINSTYGEYLPQLLTESTSIRELADNYKLVEDAMRKVQMLKASEEGKQAIDKKYGADIEEEKQNLIKSLQASLVGVNKYEAQQIVEVYAQRILEGAEVTLSEVAKQFLGEKFELQKVIDNAYTGEMRDASLKTGKNLIKLIEDRKEKEEDLNKIISARFSYTEFDTLEARNKAKAIDDELNAELILIDKKERSLELSKKELALAEKEGLTTLQFATERNNIIKQEEIATAKREAAVKRLQLLLSQGMISQQGLNTETQKMDIWATKTVKSVNDQISKLNFSDVAKAGILITEESAAQGWSGIIDKAVGSYNQAEEALQRMLNLQAAGNKVDKDEINRLQTKRDLQYELLRILGALDSITKKGGSSKNTELEKLKLQIKLLSEARTAYEKMWDATGRSEDSLKALDQFKDRAEDIELNFQTIADYASTDKLSLSNIVKGLDPLKDIINESTESLTKFQKETKRFGLEQTSKLDIDATISMEESNIKAFRKSMENAVSGYELGIKMDEMGDLGNIFRDQMESLDVEIPAKLSIIDLKKKLLDMKEQIEQSMDYAPQRMLFEGGIGQTDEDYFAELEAFKNKQSELIADINKQIASATEKQNMETAKNWRDLLSKYSSYEYKRTEISKQAEKERLDFAARVGTDEEFKKVTTLQVQLSTTTDASKKAELQNQLTQLLTSLAEKAKVPIEIPASINTKEIQDLAKVDFEMFKDSDEWLAIFGDLDRLSKTSIDIILERLKNFKVQAGAQLNITEAKELESAFVKIREASEKLGGLETLKEAFSQFREASREANEYKNKLSKLKVGSDEYLATAKKLRDAEDKKADAAKKGENALSTMSTNYTKLNDIMTQTIDTVYKLADGLGLAIKEEDKEILDAFVKGFSVMIPVLAAVTAGMYLAASATLVLETALFPLLIIALALGAAFAIAFALFEAFDPNKKIDKQVEQSEKAVDRLDTKLKALENQYSELERAIDKSMGAANIQSRLASIQTQKQILAVEQLKKAELERQLELEKSRKSKSQDEDKINDLEASVIDAEKSVLDASNNIQDSIDAIAEELIGNNIKDAAEEFAETFINAWRQGEDVMQALEEKFDESIDNMINKAIMSAVIAKKLKPMFDALNKWEAGEITDEELYGMIGNIMGMKESITEGIRDVATNVMDILGIKFGGAATEGLSNLQKGIGAITEQTAGSIEAHMNILKFNSYENLEIAREGLIINQTQLATQNNILLQARDSYQLLQSLVSWTRDITTNSNSTGGNGIKIYMQ